MTLNQSLPHCAGKGYSMYLDKRAVGDSSVGCNQVGTAEAGGGQGDGDGGVSGTKWREKHDGHHTMATNSQ